MVQKIRGHTQRLLKIDLSGDQNLVVPARTLDHEISPANLFNGLVRLPGAIEFQLRQLLFSFSWIEVKEDSGRDVDPPLFEQLAVGRTQLPTLPGHIHPLFA